MIPRRWLAAVVGAALAFPGLTGCGSNNPVDKRALVLLMGFAPAKHHRIRMVFQIPTGSGLTSLTTGATGSSGGPGSSAGKTFYVLQGIGATPGVAFARAQTQVGQDLYLGQVQVVAFSAQLNTQQMAQAQDWINRLGTMDKSAFATATPSVRQLFDRQPSVGGQPAIYLHDTLSCPTCSAVTFDQRQWTIETSLANHLAPDATMFMPWITTGPAGFRVAQVAVYHRFRLATILSRTDTDALGFVLGRTKKADLHFVWQGHQIGIRAVDASPHRTTSWHGGKMQIRLHLSVVGTLEEAVDMELHASTVHHIEQLGGQLIAEQVLHTLVLLQGRRVNPAGFGEAYAWQHPALSYPHLQTGYAHADIVVTVKLHLINTGDIT